MSGLRRQSVRVEVHGRYTLVNRAGLQHRKLPENRQPGLAVLVSLPQTLSEGPLSKGKAKNGGFGVDEHD